MLRPKICGVIVNAHQELIQQADPFVDLWEVRLDLIGSRWAQLLPGLYKPWIACHRKSPEAGSAADSDVQRIERLRAAIRLGAWAIDVELETAQQSPIVSEIHKHTRCLISFHDWETTPPLAQLLKIAKRMQHLGADIGKIVTTAQSWEDNLVMLELLSSFPDQPLVAFCMGSHGVVSRILSPWYGGLFTYASLDSQAASAPGQIPAPILRQIYDSMLA